MFEPIFASALDEKDIPKASVDLSDFKNPLWEIFSVQVVPTIILFKDGKPVFRADGILGGGLSRESLNDMIQRA